jgi:hypothetical protein
MPYPTEEDIRSFEKQLNQKDDKEGSDTIINLNSQKIISDKPENSENQANIVILSMSKNIDLIFDKGTGKILYITYNKNPKLYSYNDNDKNILNVPIPDEIKDLNRNDIISKSTTLIGSIISVKSTKLSGIVSDPAVISFILFEKIDESDNFDIKLIPNLEFNDIVIKENHFRDVIFANINTFWVIIKDDNNVQQLIYYYKSSKYIYNAFNYNYLYDSISITEYTFICSLWSYHDITPSVIYLIVHDEHFNVIILQYTIYNIDSKIPNITHIPKIILYSKDKRLSHCGKYLSHCVNYNISMFSLLLEIENNVKMFYTGIITLFTDKNTENSKLLLDISYSHSFPKQNISIEEAQFMLYTIMEKTEKTIKIQNFKENEEEIKLNKKLTYIKEKKEDEAQKAEELKKKKEKEAELMAEALIKEEELEHKKKKAQQNTKSKKIKVCINPKSNTKKGKLIEKERLEKERLEKERLEKERLEKERLEKDRIENERLEKERLLEKDRIEKERLEKDRIENERIVNERLMLEKLENIKLLKKKNNEKKKERQRIKKETQYIENEKILEEERLLQQNKLLNEAYLKQERNKEVISNYHISNYIERKKTEYTIFYSFIYYLSMIDPKLASKIMYLSSEDTYVEIMYNNRTTIMYALDMLVISNIHILSIKKKLDENKLNDYNITAIYGSILPVVYSLILNEIGYYSTQFHKYTEPLKMIDVDTMVIKLLDNFIETDTQTEYIKEPSVIIDYYTDEKPITRTKVQSSSFHNLLCNCWDLNYTSALLIYEEEKEPYIIRHPDFTEFIFGNQPIQLLFGKNENTLFNYDITMKRLEKIKQKWCCLV